MTPQTYRFGEPPRRSEIPDRDPRIVAFIRAENQEAVVTVGGRVLEHKIVYHSPDGFEFGYLGSGPAELALNLLALVVSEEEAFRLHQDFKFALLRSIHHHGGELRMQDILEWIRGTYQKELSDPKTVEQEKLLREYAAHD